MDGMSELDAEVTAKVRGIAFFNHCKAAHRHALVIDEGRAGGFLLSREAEFWRRLLEVIDGSRQPTRDEQYVLDQVRTPIEGVALAKAKAAANKNGKGRAERLKRLESGAAA